jgi:tRNA(Ile)-lysidine synthase TilS/MesJ
VIYINPPYAEAASATTKVGTGQNKQNVAAVHKTSEKFKHLLGRGINELFAQFLIKIYDEIPSCKIAHFATLKALCAPNFAKFRGVFQAKLESLFICPSSSFDNVKGQFPIGFHFWDAAKKEEFRRIRADVYDNGGILLQRKKIYAVSESGTLNKWLHSNFDHIGNKIAYLRFVPSDFQNNNGVYITNHPKESDIRESRITGITTANLIPVSVYFTVRKIISATWLNDRDQFLSPNSKWKKDVEFQNDCLAYTLFNNNIQSEYGANHWIPFLESEINARDKFDSHFMMSFINGKLMQNRYSHLFEQDEDKTFIKREFSVEAKAVFSAGKKLWTYYHSQKKCNVNASLYDIREHFQGRNDKGKMNNTSKDETYNELIADLRSALKTLAKKIEPKVYEYGFLKR